MCAANGLELVETGVGFKYIAAEMIKGGVLLGAEESAESVFRDISRARRHRRRPDAARNAGHRAKAGDKNLSLTLKRSLVRIATAHDTHFPLEKRAQLMES